MPLGKTLSTKHQSRHEMRRSRISMPANPASNYRRNGLFIQKHEDWLSSPAYRHLPPAARCLLEELQRLYRPGNNGNIGLSTRRAGDLVNIKKDTAGKRFKELIKHGFISQEKEAEYRRGQAREWRLTFMSGSDGSNPTDEWKKWKPTTPQKNTRDNSNCPKAGDTTVPPIRTPLSQSRGQSKISINRHARIQ